MVELVWLIPALPLAGFVLLVLFGKRLGDPLAGWLATLLMLGSFAASVIVFAGLLDRPAEDREAVQTLFTWIPAGGLHVEAGFLIDPLSVTMALFVTGVGALIHLYSIGYMKGDPRYPTFFVYLNLFAFSMLVLVLASSLVLTFLGWEGVGACSYFLISFWFTKEANASAGKKAFITNRVGDWGFLLAMFLTFTAVGSLQYTDVLSRAGAIPAVTATGIGLLLFLGACGKSAQLPLYVWLPDAMAGPTPVSALIHAATMVTAGVFLMTRMAPVVVAGYDWVPTVIAVVGALTALFAATIAVAQNDIKRVLAYSTISQLGFMFLAVGVGAYVAAVFHMIMHAFFKGLLFLGSGSVIHGMHEEQDMRRMGRLAKFLPWTAWTFIVGWLAIAGIPPFSGFWSKDEILLGVWNDNKALWVIGFVTAGLTAFYMSRQVFMVFYGKARWEEARPEVESSEAGAGESHAADAHAADAHGAFRPHESGWLMLGPLVVLAVLSTIGGVINLPFTPQTEHLARWLEPVVGGVETEVDISFAAQFALAVVTTLLCVLGMVAAYRIYLRHKVATEKIERAALAHAWYVDEELTAFMGGPGMEAFERTSWFDRNVIDGAVNGLAWLTRAGGRGLRHLQTGYVRNYALGVAVGAVILVGLLLGRA